MTPDSIIVRHAAPTDAAGYIALIKGVLREDPPVDTPYAPDEFDPTAERMALRILDAHDEPNSCFIVALHDAPDDDEEVVGALTCGGGSLKADAHVTSLGLYVAKPWRGQGIGRALMQAALDWARASGVVQRVELEVFAENARAIHLYESFGFEHEGRKRRMYHRNGAMIDMLMMSLLIERTP